MHPPDASRSGWPRFQVRHRPIELVEPREGGVDVRLVEDFAAVDQVAFERQNRDLSPLGVEALSEVPFAAKVTTAPRLISRCTASM